MDTVTTLVSVPAIVALVNLAKDLGLATKLAAPLAVVLGIGLAVGERLVDSRIWEVVTLGTLFGLGAAGLFDMTKRPAATERLD